MLRYSRHCRHVLAAPSTALEVSVDGDDCIEDFAVSSEQFGDT